MTRVFKLFEFTNYLDEVIEEYKAILNRQNLEELKKLEELEELLNSIILYLISNFILKSIYFKQTESIKTLTNKTFIFMPDKYLTTILDELETKRILGKGITHSTSQQKGISQNNTAMLERYMKVVGKLPPVYPGQLEQNYLTTNTQMKELYKKFERIAGRKAYTNTNTNTNVGGMRKIVSHKQSNHKSNNYRTVKRKTPKQKTKNKKQKQQNNK